MIKIPLDISLREAERLFITETLERNNGNRTQSAKQLQIGVRTLQRKLKAWKCVPVVQHSEVQHAT